MESRRVGVVMGGTSAERDISLKTGAAVADADVDSLVTELMAIPLPPELPELRVWMVGAHMHYLGVNAQVALIRPDAEDPRDQQECLLSAPRYQFEWQRTYAYDAPTDALPIARGGDTLLIRCEYDNSLDNPALAEVLAERGLDAPVDVELGDGTLDEMCLGVFGVIYPRALADEGWRP